MSENELIEKYVTLAEETIRLQPESYLWTNRRWKLAPPQATSETVSDESDEIRQILTLCRVDHINLSKLNQWT